MKRTLLSLVFIALAISLFAQDLALPRPGLKSGVDLISAIQNRRVARAFVRKPVSTADLSTLLWAALGQRGVDAVASATKAGRTASFSGDNAYLNLYVLSDKGSWKYLAETHTLKGLGAMDARAQVSRAAIPEAAYLFVFTADTNLAPSFVKANPTVFLQMAHATAGFAAENLALAASALKLAAIVQYTLAPAEAAKALQLPPTEVPLFILQAGYTE